MHIARIRQDFPSAPSPPVTARPGTGHRQADGPAPSVGVLPAERVVEGEWQKHGGVAGDSPFERVWRARREGETAQHPLPPEARRAIDAYRDQAAFFDRRASSSVVRVDYYA